MKRGKWILVVILLLNISTIHAFTPKREYFYVENNTNRFLVINIEYREDVSDKNGFSIRDQNGYEIELWLCVGLENMYEFFLSRPNSKITIISYSAGFLHYNQMISLPFIDKARAIFKRFEVICEDGRILITLENLEENIVVQDERFYTLEIFD